MPALALDAGQTTIKVAVVGAPTAFTATLPGVQTSRSLLPQLADAVRAARAASPVGFDEVAIGTSGLTATDDDPQRLHGLLDGLGIRRLILAHDSITSYLGCLGAQPGVVCAAGTGVVTLGVGARAMARVDGWGYLMGDAGSGYWIGRRTLEAVMRALDGRGQPTALTAPVRAHFGALETAYIALQTDPDQVRIVASFAVSCAEAAAAGDPVALAISADAGRELAASIVAAARRVELVERPTVCFAGAVFRSAPVAAACTAELALALPTGTIVRPAGDGLAGAISLLTLPSDHPLSLHIAVSEERHA